MSASPIEIIYGFNLSSPLDQVPIPTTNQFRSDIEKEGRAKLRKLAKIITKRLTSIYQASLKECDLV